MPKREQPRNMARSYQCESVTVEGFIQQLAVSYVSNGYYFYVMGFIPEGKDPSLIDQKLINRYDIDISKWSRARRKRAGKANMQYLRHGQLFVLLATHGEHVFFSDEYKSIRDVRRVPLKAFGYAISHKAGHVHVRIEKEEFKRQRSRLLDLACHRKAEIVAARLSGLQFEPYAPVRRQLLQLLRQVNRVRRAVGYERLPPDILRFRRRIVRPFGRSSPEISDFDPLNNVARHGEFASIV